MLAVRSCPMTKEQKIATEAAKHLCEQSGLVGVLLLTSDEDENGEAVVVGTLETGAVMQLMTDALGHFLDKARRSGETVH